MAKLRPADHLLAPVVAEVIKFLELTPADSAVVQLAQQYAEAIDVDPLDPAVLDKLGPKLLACLEALGASPAARQRLKGGGSADAASNRLQLLREARRAH